VRDDGTGSWTVPLSGLLAAGFEPTPDRTEVDRDSTSDRAEIERLQAELRVVRVERDTARDLVGAHERALADLRSVLRVLEAGPQPTPNRAEPEPQGHEAPRESPWRRWLRQR
jgi:hypothetical protein